MIDAGLTMTEKESYNHVGPEPSPGIELGFKRRSGNSPRDSSEAAKGIEGLPRVRRGLAEGDRELARKASGVHRNKTKRLTGRSSEIIEKLAGRLAMTVKGMTIKCWARVKFEHRAKIRTMQ
ncbi:hypothetical protein GW17_00031285 [Ensete ventricosum]|nr:hypothetical protein GW17_00031285 [Ensete ventricosum]